MCITERDILDMNLGGHEAVVGDADQDGNIDICSKPWNPDSITATAGATTSSTWKIRR